MIVWMTYYINMMEMCDRPCWWTWEALHERTRLDLNNCPECGRKAETAKCVGGWTVSCYYSDAFNCVDDNEGYCDGFEWIGFYETELKAIEGWNEKTAKPAE